MKRTKLYWEVLKRQSWPDASHAVPKLKPVFIRELNQPTFKPNQPIIELKFFLKVHSWFHAQVGSNLPKRCQNTVQSTIHLKNKCWGEWFCTFFGDSSQSEKLSEIKTPLYHVWRMLKHKECQPIAWGNRPSKEKRNCITDKLLINSCTVGVSRAK
jgi:hypothetical protein